MPGAWCTWAGWMVPLLNASKPQLKAGKCLKMAYKPEHPSEKWPEKYTVNKEADGLFIVRDKETGAQASDLRLARRVEAEFVARVTFARRSRHEGPGRE